MLDDAVEEHGEKPTVNQPGRAFVDQRESDSPRGGLTVETIEVVLGEARIERADVRRVIQVDPRSTGLVDPDPRRTVRRNRRAQLAFPLADLRDDRIHRGVRMFQRQQQITESADGARCGDGLGQRRLTESGGRSGRGACRCLVFAHPTSSRRLCSAARLSLLSYTAKQLYCLL